MKQLQITNRNYCATVDDEDYDRLNLFSWIRVGTENRFTIARVNLTVKVPLANEVMQNYENMYDHKDQNPLNNLKSNLRITTQSQNSCNRTKIWNGSSKFKGVSYWTKANKWEARITFKRKTIRIGLFLDEISAAKAYNEKAKELHGEFAVLNII